MMPFAIGALIFCLFLVALFSASEAVLAATNRVRLRHLLRAQTWSDEQSAAHSLSTDLSRDAQQFIATVTIAANVPLMGASAMTVLLARHYGGRTTTEVAVCAGAAFFTVVLFQIAPRLLIAQPGALDRLWWVRPARFLLVLLRPPVAILLALGRLLLRPLGLLNAPATAPQDGEEPGLESAHEIRDLVESAQAAGILEDTGRELIDSIFTFGDTRVHEVMLPRPEIVALPVDGDCDAILNALEESGLSRLPVYEGNIDRVVGILHVKDVLVRLTSDSDGFDAASLMREPLFVPESLKIDEALETMRARRTHLAIVIDEFGGTAGLLTVEDILEELVGDITDEHDRKVDESLQIVDSRTALVDALLHTEDLFDRWRLELPDGKFDTVGGFVIEQLGRAPVAGDRINVPGAVLEVHTVRGRRPQKILITRHEDDNAGERS